MKINELMGDVIGRYTKHAKAAQNGVEFRRKEAADVKDSSVVKQEGDRVEISESARMLLQMESGDSEKASRLNKIRQQIENGTYKPDVEATARAILKEWENG